VTVGAERSKSLDIAGLDTIRFLAAMFVAFDHGLAFPVKIYVPEKSDLWLMLIGLNGNAFNGVAAVIIFFIISGFCIHYKFARGERFLTVPYMLRRMIRIVIPVACALILANLISPEAKGALELVVWTLYCEMIYYTLYPVFRIIFRYSGIVSFTGLSFVVTVCLILTHWEFVYFQQFTIFTTWLVCLPAWLLGCLLAETVANRRSLKASDDVVHKRVEKPNRSIWIWRLVGWSYATFVQVFFFHGPIKLGYPILLLPFIPYAFFWINQEIEYFRVAGAPKLLEWAGRWSYSIYLMHGIVLVAMTSVPGIREGAFLWSLRVFGVLLGSYAFFLIVERPAQQLARIAGYWFTNRQNVS
jgi:peptidoglycan/LPS O-acetylase OafA/YrhL